MSRIFEALKLARQSRGPAADERLWEAMEVPSGQGELAEPHEITPALVNMVPFEVPIQTSTGVEEVESPAPGVLDGIEAQARMNRTARLIPHAVNPLVVEHYRRLRTKILQEQETKPFRTLVVTSASPREGKTVTTLNLALSFSALSSFKVIVIDGDVRRGTMGEWLGVSEEQPGLSNLLDGSAKLEEVVLRSNQIPMHFMVRGTSDTHDLRPSHFSDYFRRLSEIYDLVLIDSPPVNLLADVQLLAANSDAILLVARAFATTRKSLEKAIQELAPFRIIGAVLNAGVAQRSGQYYGYYYGKAARVNGASKGRPRE